MKFIVVLLLVVMFAWCGSATENHSDGGLGLTVQNGVLTRNGQPYRGIGANYFSLFSRMLSNPEDTSSLSNLALLAKAEIPFVRFMCGGFWPVEQRLYLTNRAAYFERLDRVVRCAERNAIGLIPSLFWHAPTVPDLSGEHMDAYGSSDSKTIELVRRYTEDVVQRYKDSPAIWGWEFGNEYNLDCDLPNASEHRPPVWPNLGTAKRRTERDELKFAHLKIAYVEFAKAVRRCDRTRPIFTGNSIPRRAAWHNVNQKKWTADSETQFAEILRRDNPDPVNTISVHLYPESKGGYSGGATTIGEAVAVANKHSLASGKPLCIGEFGVSRQHGGRAEQEAAFQEFLGAIVRERVPLAMFWVFDFAGQDKDWNVTFANDRAWMIERVRTANSQLRK